MRRTLTARAPAPGARKYESDSKYLYDFGLYNGRFQIVHEGHVANFKAMAEKCYHPIINIGSINQSRDTRNPLDFEQRKCIWQAAILGEFGADTLARTSIIGQEDLGNPVRWASAVEKQVSAIVDEYFLPNSFPDVAIFGHRKDPTSFYLDDFPNYILEEVDAVDGVSATQLRDQLFHFSDSAYADKWLDTQIPYWNVDVLRDFMGSPDFADLLIEQKKIDEAAEAWEGSPYPVIFNTADAIIVQGNRLLMVKRRGYPGKGLWALPGGFINYRERVIDAAIREATEETGIDVSKTVLRNALVDTFFEDNPWRSTRGRTITFASIFHLKPTPRGKTPAERRKSMALPFVKGMDDAELADWVTFDEVRAMRSSIFEDHAILIDRALERLGVR